MNSSTSCILSRSILKYGKVEHLHVETACLTVIFKTLGLIRLRRILSYRQISNPLLANCVTHHKGLITRDRLSNWQALPRRWLLSRYNMDRTNAEQPFLYRDWKQCAWAVWYPMSCFSLGYLSGCPASVITRKISSRDPGITILGSQLTGLAQLSCNRRVDFCCVYN